MTVDRSQPGPQINRDVVVTTALAVAAIVLAWFVVCLETIPAAQLTVKRVTGPAGPTVRAELNGRPVEGVWLATPTGWRITVPPAMNAMASACRVKVTLAPGARRPGVVVNGKALGDRRKLTIPANRLCACSNVIRLRATGPEAIESVRLRNYSGINHTFPNVCVVRRDGPQVRPPDALGLAALAAFLACVSLAALGGARWFAVRGGVPLWTADQWTRTAGWPAAVATALALWNTFAPYKVIFSQGTLVGLVVLHLAASAVWCGWRNVVRMRWQDFDEATRRQWLERRRVVLLFVGIWLAYNLNFDRVGEVDGKPAPRMAISLLRHGDLDLDEYPDLQQGDMPLKFTGTHWVSRWTPGSALWCVPFMLVPTLAGVEAPSAAVDMLAKLVASTLTALSAVFVYLVLRRLTSVPGAVWLTVAYALGTASFPISAQDTWQHAPTQLCLAMALWIVLKDEVTWRGHLAAGVLLGFVPLCRPLAVLFALPVFLWSGRRHGWRALGWTILGGLPPVLFLAGYNWHYFGTPGLGGYQGIPGGGWIPEQMPMALLGLLVSPNRGLFVFSPFVLMLVYGAWRGATHPERRWRELAWLIMAVIVAHLVITSAWKSWHAIRSFGSRYTVDAMPLWAVLGAFGIGTVMRHVTWRRVFVILVCLSIAIQSLGVFVSLRPWHDLQWPKIHRTRVANVSRFAWAVDPPQILFQIQYGLGLVKDAPADGKETP